MELNLEMASLDLQDIDLKFSTEITYEESTESSETVACGCETSDNHETKDVNEVDAGSGSQIQTQEKEEEQEEITIQVRRSSRKRNSVGEVTEKRRVYTKPTKLSEHSDDAEIQNYYLSKRIKRLPPALETIFEEPKTIKNESVYTSAKKFKRMITFHDDAATPNRLKVKKRQMKAKKLLKGKKCFSSKLSLDMLKEKLKCLESVE